MIVEGEHVAGFPPGVVVVGIVVVVVVVRVVAVARQEQADETREGRFEQAVA